MLEKILCEVFFWLAVIFYIIVVIIIEAYKKEKD